MRSVREKLERLVEAETDVLAAAVGFVLSVALLPLGFVTTDILVQGIPTALGVGCLLYLLAVRSDSRTSSRTAGVASFRTTVPVSRLVPRFVVVGLSSLVVIAAAAGGRPVAFHLVAGTVGSLVLAQIVFASVEELDYRVVLVEIVALAVVVRYAGLLTTPGFIGFDNWTHVTSYAAAIQETGSLSAISGVKYYTAPFYHLLTVAAAELFDVSLRAALYLGIGLVMPLSVLFVYATTRYVTGVRWALFATALFAGSDYVIYWGLYISTTSLGLVFFLAVLFFLTRALYTEVDRVDFALLAAFSIVVALTHQVSAFITLVFLGTTTVVLFAARFVEGMSIPSDERYLLGAFGIFLAFVLVQWAVTPWLGGLFITGVIEISQRWISESVGFLNLVQDVPTRGGEPVSTGVVARIAAYVDKIGFFLLLAVAAYGCLTMLQRDRSVATYTFIGAITATMVFLMGLPLFGFRFLVPPRWYAFMYAPMVVVGAAGIRHFVIRLGAHDVAVVLIVFLLVFPTAMMVSQPATIDNPTFERQWQKWAHTAPEVAAGETFHETIPADGEPIYTDNPYFRALTRVNEDPERRFEEEYSFSAYMFTVTDDGQVTPEESPVVYRAYQSEGRPVYLGPDGFLTTGRLPQERVCPRDRNYVYTAEDVVMCTTP
ncbi:hypothetical protein [Halostella salina]|uniref:hypothetical protein n=1 Tax=Halostella salina TaxID=1547897 RepID=UPI000EF76A5D|nr:hypothetical protein [Halostella salina]